jgi:hypothetical protein
MTQTSYKRIRRKNLMKKPRWSLKTSFFVALGILSITTPLVYLILDTSFWARLELIVAIASLFIFAFLFWVLYQGVCFDKNERYRLRWVRSPEKVFDSISDIGFIDVFSQGADDLVSAVIGFVVDLLITILLIILIGLLFRLGVNLIVGGITAVTIPLFFLYGRSIRYIVGQGRRCRGNVGKSLLYALRYTFINTTLCYLMLFIGQCIAVANR